MTKVTIRPENQKEEIIISTDLSLEGIKKLIKKFEKEKYETATLSKNSLKKNWFKLEEYEAWKGL